MPDIIKPKHDEKSQLIKRWDAKTGRGHVFYEGKKINLCRRSLHFHGTLGYDWTGWRIAFFLSDVTEVKEGDKKPEYFLRDAKLKEEPNA